MAQQIIYIDPRLEDMDGRYLSVSGSNLLFPQLEILERFDLVAKVGDKVRTQPVGVPANQRMLYLECVALDTTSVDSLTGEDAAKVLTYLEGLTLPNKIGRLFKNGGKLYQLFDSTDPNPVGTVRFSVNSTGELPGWLVVQNSAGKETKTVPKWMVPRLWKVLGTEGPVKNVGNDVTVSVNGWGFTPTPPGLSIHVKY